MGMPFYMEYETRYNNKKNYPDIFQQFRFVIENMRNPLNGLYFHAIDTSKKMFWCDKVTGLSQLSWLQGYRMVSQWHFLTLLISVTRQMRSTLMISSCMRDAFVDLIDSMLKYQDESGMWYQIVNLWRNG